MLFLHEQAGQPLHIPQVLTGEKLRASCESAVDGFPPLENPPQSLNSSLSALNFKTKLVVRAVHKSAAMQRKPTDTRKAPFRAPVV